MTGTEVRSRRGVGAPLTRIEGPDKVTGAARYAYEYGVEGAAYCWLLQAGPAKGRVVAVDSSEAESLPGVVQVLWHANVPRLEAVEDPELAVLQSDRVSYSGQIVAAVVADDPETARQAVRLLHVEIEPEPHRSELSVDDPGLYTPEKVNPGFPSDTEQGDPDRALAEAPVTVDVEYRTPAYHNNPMEPHATIAAWHGDHLTVHDSNQGASTVQATLSQIFAIAPGAVDVVAPHVGGGFGSKGTPRPIVVMAALAARVVGRPVKLAATRQQMFAFVGYRTPTIQRLRLGAEPDGRLTALVHDVVEQTSQIREFAEQTAVASRMVYAADHRRTTHRLARLDVPTPSWMRAPGEAPGMYALESAMDELAEACGVDPLELRARNEPDLDPETGHPFSSRNLQWCLREGARRFGWHDRDPAPGTRRDGRWLVGSGVAASTYPARSQPSQARASVDGSGRYRVELAAADIGTGSRTALTLVAASALGVDPEQVTVELGASHLPDAPLAGGSMGTSSWGWAVDKACRHLVTRIDPVSGVPPEGLSVSVSTDDEVAAQEDLARHAFGAQFAEVRVDPATGEIRVTRMVGAFAAGTIVNPVTARSQFLGGMIMGLSMALLEESILDPAFGDYVNKDLADYHVATYADVPPIDVTWLDEHDDRLNGVGTKGIGEIGIVGTAAAIGNAVWHATGRRFRRLPISVADVIDALG